MPSRFLRKMNGLREYKKLLQLLGSEKRRIQIIIVNLLAIMVIQYFNPLLVELMVDEGITEQNTGAIWLAALLLIIIALVNAILNMVVERQRLSVYKTVRYKLESDAFKKLLSIHMSFFEKHNSTEIREIIREDINVLSGIVGEDTFSAVTGFVSAIGGGIALFYMDYRIALMVIAFIPICMGSTKLFSKKNVFIIRQYINESAEYSQIYGDSISGIRDIRLLGVQDKQRKIINEKLDSMLSRKVEQGVIQKGNVEVHYLINESLSILIYILSGIVLAKQNISIGKIIAFETYSLILLNPVIEAIDLLFMARAMEPNLKRYYSLLDEPDERTGKDKSIERLDIDINNVSFTYEDKIVLNNLTLSVKQGEKVALIGRNGSGKTTLLNLILRILNPDSGTILLGGKNIQEYDIETYRSCFSSVSQSIHLFQTSIRENIRYHTNIDDETITKVCREVNLERLITEKGLDYVVGENGSCLSGGQCQKIVLARALVANRPILILDEATSNLDLETIDVLRKLFRTRLKDKTVICVTHSAKMLDLFDHIIELEKQDYE